ncbi:MAG TPA: glycosyltransferase [Oscillospiraceae bacterium]|nr:glycosyltransferase [Oscillospiraceae bacterium]HPF55927.1 glycosyltransferase [Clostridiales bacterium]HPK36117.1 glycosyltransferase [Oscillospiraceae bacterium]HPR76559.1 glycosyltransferase [Oscillospiraceae bacterium]
MKVALLTMFNGLSNTYSLVNVVAEHLKMLLDAGISTKVLVSQDCSDEERRGIFADERLEWVKITNRIDGKRMEWHDYALPNGTPHETFFAETEAIAADLKNALADVDVCIMHDIHYQGWHLIHNVAIRKAQENLPKVRFIAFTHSAPVNRPPVLKYPFSCRYTPMPNTVYVYPTHSGIPALARQYGVPEGRCRVVYNSVDLITPLSEDLKQLHNQTDLLKPDILIVYPGRFTPGKKFEKTAALAGAIRKKTELTVKVIFCDFPCMDIEPAKYKLAVRMAGCLCGLDEEDMAFTSDLGWPHGFPRSGVFELFTLSNLFICPSYSESFGLTVLEAASRGNFLVLNEAVPALEELGKRLGAYFMRWDARNFGFDTKEDYKPSEPAYLEEHAARIVDRMRDNAVLRAKTLVRREFNPDWIWYNQLQPLIEDI